MPEDDTWPSDPAAAQTADLTEPESKEDTPVEEEAVVTSPAGESDVEGVKVGGLEYTENPDGTRHYPEQEPVETTGDPTPTPQIITDAQPPQNTSDSVGQ
jgi:hypothetical protein